MTNDPTTTARTGPFDSPAIAVGMVLAAVTIGYAVTINDGDYAPAALGWLTVAMLAVFTSLAVPAGSRLDRACRRILTAALVISLAAEGIVGYQVLHGFAHQPMGSAAPKFMGIMASIAAAAPCVLLLALLGMLQAFPLRSLRIPLAIILLIAFWMLGANLDLSNNLSFGDPPKIDVYMFQQMGSKALLFGQPPFGHDPFAIRFPNPYLPDTPFYGPGVVDSHNMLTYGFPYFPLSLLMALPGYVFGGDVRWSHLTAMALSAAAMFIARPGRRGIMAGALFLLTPCAFYPVLTYGWTEPILTFSFSLVMICAIRYRKALPYALGLFFATKQYTIVVLPAVWLLIESPRRWRGFVITIIKAGTTAAVITVPFFLWNPREFYLAVVQWQLIQPFRGDALSYLVWLCRQFGPPAPMSTGGVGYLGWFNAQFASAMPRWLPLAAIVPPTVFALWRCPRTPAGFAACVTIINFAFFAFNKQAFCNYYYFVIATACWAVAASVFSREQAPHFYVQPAATTA